MTLTSSEDGTGDGGNIDEVIWWGNDGHFHFVGDGGNKDDARDYQLSAMGLATRKACNDPECWICVPKPQLPEGVEMMGLYNVYLVYAEDTKNPDINGPVQVLARNEEDAKLKAAFVINPNWDTDFLTILAVELGDVKVKAKPQEVKQV